MATGTISKPLAIETAQATLTKSFKNVQSNTITKIGNLCCFQFNGVVNQSIPTWTDFLSIPYIPKNGGEVQFIGIYDDSADIMSLHENDGVAYISGKSAMASSKKLSFTVTYIADE